MVVAAAAALAVGLSACGGGGGGGSTSNNKGSTGASAANAAITGIVNPSTKQGGTMQVEFRRGDCDSYDPARTYYGFCWTLQRLFTRELMAFDSTPGSAKVVPDLATAAGTHNADNTQWTYHLKAGLKWQDGTPITTADIKYGLERLFATDQINGGPNQYYLCYLSKCDSKGNASYKGPYKDKTGGLASIQTPDATTITFNLVKPVGIWDYLMALPISAPVEKSKDTGATYSQHVQSSGPFMFKSYSPKKSVVWVRNPNWSQATDTVRHPLVNEIDGKIFGDVDQADAALLAGNYELAVDSAVGTTSQAKIISNPNMLKYSDDPAGGYKLYISVHQTVPPLTNVHCRRAIFYAMNKSDLIKADGGTYGGTVANTLTPPTLPGYSATENMYPTGPDNTGDLVKAKAELTQCGQPNGFAVNMGYQTGGGKATKEFEAVQQALSRVKIKVTGLAADPSNYYSSFIGSPSNIVKQKIGIAWNGWAPDFPLAYGYWKSIADGSSILPNGNYNTPSLNDPKVNAGIAAALTDTADKQAADEELINNQVMTDAVYVPYSDSKGLFFRSSKLTNVTMLKGTGDYYDIVNMGVQQ
jgi:peptide/nickel transport system substrate-binding protein